MGAGQGDTNVPSESGISGPAWTPDGRIVFEEELNGHRSIWSVDAAGNDRKQLTPEASNYDHSVSRNGQKLAFVSEWIAGFYADRTLNAETTPTSIAVIASDGGPVRKVIPIPFSVMVSGGLRWNPNGRELSYIDRKKDGANIWTQSLDGAAPHQITRFQGVDLFSFDWSSDGKQLAISRGIETRDVVLMEDAYRK